MSRQHTGASPDRVPAKPRPRSGPVAYRAVMASCAALLAAALPVSAADLVLLNWPAYIDPALVARFEASRHVDVAEVPFTSDDVRDAMMLETGGSGYDVVLINGANFDAQVQRGWLAPTGEAQVPNLRHIEPRWRAAIPAAEGYGVPYFWGLIGIAYHGERLTAPITRWMDLFRPAPELHGRIAMLNNARDVTGLALKALGHSVNSADPAELEAAAQLLLEQERHVRTYDYQGLDSELLASGEVLAALAFSGDWIVTHRAHPEIDYVVPAEGTVLWVDYLAVTSASQRKALAWDFIDFLNEPDNARQLAEFVSYPTPNRAAAARLPRSMTDNPVMYPPPEVLARAEPLARLPPLALRRMNATFARLTD